MIIGDFKEEPKLNPLKIFADENLIKLNNLIKKKQNNKTKKAKKNNCFRKESGRCIDLILTNKLKSFQFSNAYETGCSDHQSSQCLHDN